MIKNIKFKLMLLIFVLFMFVIASYANEKDKLEITIYYGYYFIDVKSNKAFDKNYNLYHFDTFPIEPLIIKSKYKLDGSFLFGAKLGYYFNKNIEIEVNVGIAPTHNLTKEIDYICPPGKICILKEAIAMPIILKENIIAYNYDSNFVYNFNSDRRIVPYITMGLGGISYDIDDEIKTMGTINAGIGFKWYFEKVGLRFEFNERAILNHFISDKTEYNMQIKYGIIFPF